MNNSICIIIVMKAGNQEAGLYIVSTIHECLASTQDTLSHWCTDRQIHTLHTFLSLCKLACLIIQGIIDYHVVYNSLNYCVMHSDLSAQCLNTSVLYLYKMFTVFGLLIIFV